MNLENSRILFTIKIRVYWGAQFKDNDGICPVPSRKYVLQLFSTLWPMPTYNHVYDKLNTQKWFVNLKAI